MSREQCEHCDEVVKENICTGCGATQRHRTIVNVQAETKVCTEILEIMAVYHEQEASPSGVGTPGGLEHMGDVWSLFSRWEDMLRKAAP